MQNKKYFKGFIVILLLALLLTACSEKEEIKAGFSAEKIEREDINLILSSDFYRFDINAYDIINRDENQVYSVVLKKLENGESTEIWRQPLRGIDEFAIGESRIFFNFTADKFVFNEENKLKNDGKSLESSSFELDADIAEFVNMNGIHYSYNEIGAGELEKEAILFYVAPIDNDEIFDSNDYSEFKGKAVVVSVVKD